MKAKSGHTMDKLELLSNIRLGEIDTKNITNFFETIKNVEDQDTSDVNDYIVQVDNLREDVVKPSSEEEKALIMSNFQKKQGTYLQVPKIIQ